ncbi:DsbA family protein [Marinobacter bryozoorum]|uniref:DsbA family protein n=1 Tax=Marinobacter bryozoorum TaxID=256324 RepID=UPI002006D30F|nr:thioredoxin domain-containing protein [Marinobacter bryozoorum]MCK7543716.1 DsbA family protein [Marinobacter bryozoorum]
MGEAKRRQETGSPAPRNRSRKGVVYAGLVIIAVAVLAALYYLTQPSLTGTGDLPDVSEDTPAFPAELDRYGISVGSEDAGVVVREFADYQCPACARFAGASQRLKEEYVESGKVRFVFFDLPLRQHTHAMTAAMAARCAGDQDQYWAMHDRLFEEQSSWDSLSDAGEQFSDYADDLGLNTRRFNRCLESELHREAVEESRQVATRLQVASTPTVLVDNIPLNRPGWEQLSAVVERELNEQ